ncbi:MAG TPA: peptidyl-prolyl cis-trans isomerase [Woeseiaceae bacterium]|nr:peptidyl-prolyl cis-trans isomerase [Woeseiaceae bacterium]
MRWLKEPLLHFLLLGALIFAANAWMNGNTADDRNSIVVSLSQQENLASTFARTWQRPPTPDEMNSLIVDFIRQEIAYRESQAMQLDRDDIVIRRRLRQKLEMLAEDVASLAPPTEEEVKAYFAENIEDYKLPAVLSIRQIYFGGNGDAADKHSGAAKLLQQLQRDESSVDIAAAGDASLLPRELEGVSETELDSLFGSGFSSALATIEVGSWGGPVASGFGLHLVKVDNRVESRLPELEAVADYVTRELLVIRRRQAIDALYAKLAENYSVSIEASPEILPNPPSGSTP